MHRKLQEQAQQLADKSPLLSKLRADKAELESQASAHMRAAQRAQAAAQNMTSELVSLKQMVRGLQHDKETAQGEVAGLLAKISQLESLLQAKADAVASSTERVTPAASGSGGAAGDSSGAAASSRQDSTAHRWILVRMDGKVKIAVPSETMTLGRVLKYRITDRRVSRHAASVTASANTGITVVRNSTDVYVRHSGGKWRRLAKKERAMLRHGDQVSLLAEYGHHLDHLTFMLELQVPASQVGSASASQLQGGGPEMWASSDPSHNIQSVRHEAGAEDAGAGGGESAGAASAAHAAPGRATAEAATKRARDTEESLSQGNTKRQRTHTNRPDYESCSGDDVGGDLDDNAGIEDSSDSEAPDSR